MRNSIGNNQSGGSVSSILGSVGNIKSSNSLVEVPLSSTQSSKSFLVGSCGILENFKSSLSGSFSIGKLDGGFFKLVLSLFPSLTGKAEVILGLGKISFSSFKSILGSGKSVFSFIEIFVGSVVVFLGISKVGACLSFSKFLLVEDSLGILESFFSISQKFLGGVESSFSISKVLLSFSDIGLSSSLVEKGKVEFIFSFIQSFVGLTESVGSIFSVSVSFSSIGSSFISGSFSSNELDVDGIIESLSGSNFSFGIINGGKSIEKLLVSSDLLSEDSLDVIDEGNFVGNGDFVKGFKSSVSAGDCDKSFSCVSGLISGFNSDGVDSGNGECSDKGSSAGITNDSVREVDKGPNGFTDMVFS